MGRAETVPDGMTMYAMATATLTALTRGLGRDLGPRGITATLVHGLIHTDMNPADGPAATLLRGIPALGQYGTAEDIAATVAHLAGEGGRYITVRRSPSWCQRWSRSPGQGERKAECGRFPNRSDFKIAAGSQRVNLCPRQGINERVEAVARLTNAESSSGNAG
jgi:hypothetical protein